ncbi:MAG: biopolymer transporter ExbD [Deltaproteobacteria bacterium]|nr:biopolymer transporter ExbD [Deltaproteobacteria bacterium]MBW2253003.1 biopolymer transporter ExbD [Deltaproteobacteria bacterium]
MGAKLGTGSGPMADINVTPLCDVMLVLLVTFMVITPMLQSGMPVDLPEATQTTTVNDVGQHITISITMEQGVWVEENQVELDDVVTQIQEEWRLDPTRSLLIKADNRLEYQKVRDVMDRMAENGMDTILIAASKER